MIRILNIDKSTGVFDVPSFLLTENEELSILFKFTEDVKIGKYFVIARHGTAKKQIFSLNADMTIQLPAEWIKSGGNAPIEFALELRNVNGSSVIKDNYIIEPLIIEEQGENRIANGTIQKIQAEIQFLKSEVNDLRKAYIELKARIDSVPEEIEEAKTEAIIEASGGDPLEV